MRRATVGSRECGCRFSAQGADQSILPSSFFSGGARVACELSCGVGVIVPRVESAQRFDHQGRACFGEARVELRRGFVRRDFGFVLQQRRTCVQTRVNLHGGQAGARFAAGDGPVNRGGAAIFWQQGAVQVDPSEARNCDEARGNNLAVGDDHYYVGRGAAKIFVGFFGADFLRLVHGDSGDDGGVFYWRAGDFLAAAARAVGLRDDACDLELGLRQSIRAAWAGQTPECRKK